MVHNLWKESQERKGSNFGTYHSSIFVLEYTSLDESWNCTKQSHRFLILVLKFDHLARSLIKPSSCDNNCRMINFLLILEFQIHRKYGSKHVSVSELKIF